MNAYDHYAAMRETKFVTSFIETAELADPG